MTPREVLLAAADHIERYGWARLSFGWLHQPCCAYGSMLVTTRQSGLQGRALSEAAQAAAQILAAHLGLDASSGVAACHATQNWNDETGRTKDEVIAALRAAAGGAA